MTADLLNSPPLLLLASAAASAVLALADSARAQTTAPDTLQHWAARRGLLIGVAVAPRPLRDDDAYRQLLAREFNIVTTENALKWQSIQPRPGEFTWDDADVIVAFATEHGMKFRSHCAVWHHALPDWVAALAADPPRMRQAMRDHIDAIGARYGGGMTYWDVVNEAMEDDGTLRDTPWLRGLGPDYIAEAFVAAHAAAPAVKLVYNDYGTEYPGPKSDAVYALVRDLLGRGVPVHAVGFQMHLLRGLGDAGPIKANFQRFAELGVQVHVTELDVAIQNLEGTPARKLERQADVYRRVMEICTRVEGVTVVQTWGLSDNHSWISWFTGKPDAALLFDETYQPKPAYHAVLDVLAHDGQGPRAGDSSR